MMLKLWGKCLKIDIYCLAFATFEDFGYFLTHSFNMEKTLGPKNRIFELRRALRAATDFKQKLKIESKSEIFKRANHGVSR